MSGVLGERPTAPGSVRSYVGKEGPWAGVESDATSCACRDYIITETGIHSEYRDACPWSLGVAKVNIGYHWPLLWSSWPLLAIAQ